MLRSGRRYGDESDPSDRLAGYILAGGRNQRMGGQKKLFLPYRGGSFLSYAVDALRFFRTVYLSVEEAEPYRSLHMPLVVDRFPGAGPLGAILSGLTVCREEGLFVLPSDMPDVTSDMALALLSASRAGDGSWDNTVLSIDGGVQPLIGIYKKSCIPVMQDMLSQQRLRMKDVLEHIPHHVFYLDMDGRALRNVNSKEDYRQLIQEQSIDDYNRRSRRADAVRGKTDQ